MKNTALATLQAEIRRVGGGYKARYPAKLRQQVGELILARRADGETWTAIGGDLGVPYETLRRWSRQADAKSTAMKPVEVIVAPTSRSLTLVSPSGLRVEGASVEEIIALVRSLG